jgi:carbon monoxide dehydrogenase subunit G
MEFDNTFTVAAPIDDVWAAMLDVERVAPCVPGASVIEQTGDNAYKVAIKVRLGPVSMTYNGDVEIVEQDADARRAVMSAKARESRGQGTADATVEMRLRQENGTTEGAIHTDVAISGKAASMGQGIIGDVSARLIDTFAGNLAQMLSGPAEAAPVPDDEAPTRVHAAPAPPSPPAPAAEPEGLPVLSIAGGVIAARLRDPKVLAGLAGVLIAILLLGRRRR